MLAVMHHYQQNQFFPPWQNQHYIHNEPCKSLTDEDFSALLMDVLKSYIKLDINVFLDTLWKIDSVSRGLLTKKIV